MRLGRIAAGFAQRAPLTQQVPALVQFDLNVSQAFAALGNKRLVLEKPVLFSHQALNMGEYGLVLARFFHGIPRWMQKGVGATPNIRPVAEILQALRSRFCDGHALRTHRSRAPGINKIYSWVTTK